MIPLRSGNHGGARSAPRLPPAVVWPGLARGATKVANDLATVAALDQLGPVEQVALGAPNHRRHVLVQAPHMSFEVGALQQLQLPGRCYASGLGLLGVGAIPEE